MFKVPVDQSPLPPAFEVSEADYLKWQESHVTGNVPAPTEAKFRYWRNTVTHEVVKGAADEPISDPVFEEVDEATFNEWDDI